MNYSNYNGLIKLIQSYNLQLATAIAPVQNDARFTGKNPSKMDKNNLPVLLKQEYKQSIEDIKYQINNYPDTRLGVYLSNDIICIDIDRKHFDNDAQIELVLAELTKTYTEKTLNGGFHLLYESDELPEYQNFKLLGINEKHCGEILKVPHFLILAPSKGYIVVNDVPITKIKSIEELENIAPISNAKVKPGIGSLLIGKAKEIVTNSNPNSTDRSNDLTTVTKGLYGIRNDLEIKNQIDDYQDDVDEIIEDLSAKLGLDEKRTDRILGTINPDECTRTNTNLKGKKSKSNIMREKLNNYFSGRLRLNIMDKHLYLDNKLTSIEKLYNLAEIHLDEDFTFEKFVLVAKNIASDNSFNPIQEYLKSLPKSTQPEEALNKLYEILSIGNRTSTDKLYRKMIRKWLISAVARGLEPGCKADYVLVLKGNQGIGKTTFFQSLFGYNSIGISFFQTVDEEKDEKNKLMSISSTWCTEYGEIDYAFSVKAVSVIKAFITKQHDTYRAPYERAVNSHPRHFVFCGSTNEDRFLVDATGNRRFWTIPINNQIDTSKVAEIRNELWSAIIALYESGEKWYLDKEDEQLVTKESEQYSQEYIYTDKIKTFFAHRKKASLDEIMEKGLEIPVSQLTNRKLRKEITNTLKHLEYTEKRESTGRRSRYWVPPELPALFDFNEAIFTEQLEEVTV